jgi:hypothetical protein
MKKSTKSAKPAAPQVKSVVPKPVEPKPVKKTVAPRKKAAPKASPAVEAPAAPATTIVAPTPAHAKVSGAATTITARIDIGFGNTLFVRGEGPGLSWDRGVAMDCAADDVWSITFPEAGGQVIFKFLVNDLSWSAGSDYVVPAGKSVEFTPSF